MKKNISERSRVSKIYCGMRGRCNNKNHDKYKWYGGKGIKVEMTLDELHSIWIRDNANKLIWPSIDRKDSSKNYSVENCRFIERTENGMFKKGHSGHIKGMFKNGYDSRRNHIDNAGWFKKGESWLIKQRKLEASQLPSTK